MGLDRQQNPRGAAQPATGPAILGNKVQFDASIPENHLGTGRR